MFKKIAIANRGEVAVRIIRACQEMDIKTVLLHSEADEKSRAYRLADERVLIGPSPSIESYLNISNNIKAALNTGAEAIHPGFGFLSENGDFSEACKKEEIVFIGPSAEVIRLMGDKIRAKDIVKKLGIPVLPDYLGEDQSVLNLIHQAEELGFPVMVKAAAGGGGRGMKILTCFKEAEEKIESAQRESLSSFGSSTVFLEKYLDEAKHIEFQIFVDSKGQALHLFDRECSVQRRHQKIIEEAPAFKLSDELRRKMGEQAKLIASSVGYRGAGTVEFLLKGDEYFFLEMNTRLQVEHCVTEMILNIDLVKEQIRTAFGEESTWFARKDLLPRGHAIECRVYTEDPYQNGMPSTGVLGEMVWPEGFGRRFEVGFEKGDEVTSYYDSMIAKVIVWEENRLRAIQKMIQVLKSSIVFGLKTNIPFLIEILSHKEFQNGNMTIEFISKNFPNGLSENQLSETDNLIAQKIWSSVSSSNLKEVKANQKSPWQGAWQVL